MKVNAFKMNCVSEKLHEQYKNDLADLANDITICIANIKKWESYKNASAQALNEAMEILNVKSMSTDLHSFSRLDGKLKIKINVRAIN